MKTTGLMLSLRTFLKVGRFAVLPTVWSNCLAGWWLAGAGKEDNLPFLLFGATCFYLGGAFLNDAFDSEFDLQHRRSRPIAAGLISWRTVWRWGVAWLAIGAPVWFWNGIAAGVIGLLLVSCIVLYSATHLMFTFSPVLAGLCRLLLYLGAASASAHGINGWSVWCGFAVAAYVTGLGAIRKSQPGEVPYWPALLLASPVVLALFMNVGAARAGASLLSAVLVLWALFCLRPIWWSHEPVFKQSVAGLTAGIVFVDWLAVADAPRHISAVFLILFGTALLFQRLAQAI